MVTEAGPDQQTPGDRPLVSVIVPSYNSETHVLQTLQSVLSQTMRDLEVLAVDDASQDRTRSLIQALAERDPRVRVLVQPTNQGVALARNRGLARQGPVRRLP